MTDWVLIDTPAPHVKRITMNRPEKRNALNHPLRGAILEALAPETVTTTYTYRSSVVRARRSRRATTWATATRATSTPSTHPAAKASGRAT